MTVVLRGWTIFLGKILKWYVWYIRLVYFLSMVFVCEFLLPSMGRPLVSKASCEGLPGEGRGDGGACLTSHYNSVRRFCSLCNSSQSKTFHKSYKQTRSDPGSFSLTRERSLRGSQRVKIVFPQISRFRGTLDKALGDQVSLPLLGILCENLSF